MLHVDSEVRNIYPSTLFGIMIMKNITTPASTPSFLLEKQNVTSTLLTNFKGMSKKQLRALPPFSDYHAYYKKFKKTYHVLHQCESIASERRSLPNGPLIVQAMFMAELNNQLLTAGYDCSNLTPPYHVKLADGILTYDGMGKRTVQPPENDILFSNNQHSLGSIICGPDHRHRINDTTEQVLYAIYGVPGITVDQMEKHFADIQKYTKSLSQEAYVEDMVIL